MSETEFISAIVAESRPPAPSRQNNIYVNSRNFGFDPLEFMTACPPEKTCYIRGGALRLSPTDCWRDTHGIGQGDRPGVGSPGRSLPPYRPGAHPAWSGDTNIPELEELVGELQVISEFSIATSTPGKMPRTPNSCPSSNFRSPSAAASAILSG